MEFFRRDGAAVDQTLPMQAFTERRTFACPVRPAVAVRHDADARPALATLSCASCSWQNASWQGSRSSGSRADREERFRSAPELVLLMDSALTAQKMRLS